MTHPKGYIKSEHQDVGKRKDTYTPESGAALVAKVMTKAEANHAKGSTTGAEFRLGTNQAYHVSGEGPNNFGQ